MGALVAGTFALLIAWLVTERNHHQREKQSRIEQRTSAEIGLRHELISEVTDAAASLYYHCLQYRRARGGKFGEGIEAKDFFNGLNEQYRRSRTAGRTLEARLRAYFSDPAVAEEWHAVQDLLTVQYYDALGKSNARLREANAATQAKRHSGLSVNDLADIKKVRRQYSTALDCVTGAIMREPVNIGYL
jgi:hypothetical protein